MTPAEARIAALENDMAVVLAVISHLHTTQTLYTSIAAEYLQQLTAQVKKLRDDLYGDGDEWKRA